MGTFDTLTYAKRLKAVGFTEEQAEVQAEVLRGVIEGDIASKRDIEDLKQATQHDIADLKHDIAGLKQDLSHLESRMDGKLSHLESRMDGKLSDLKADLLKWFIGILFLQTGLIVTLLKVL